MAYHLRLLYLVQLMLFYKENSFTSFILKEVCYSKRSCLNHFVWKGTSMKLIHHLSILGIAFGSAVFCLSGCPSSPSQVKPNAVTESGQDQTVQAPSTSDRVAEQIRREYEYIPSRGKYVYRGCNGGAIKYSDNFCDASLLVENPNSSMGSYNCTTFADLTTGPSKIKHYIAVKSKDESRLIRCDSAEKFDPDAP